jgi:hypothetical protein
MLSCCLQAVCDTTPHVTERDYIKLFDRRHIYKHTLLKNNAEKTPLWNNTLELCVQKLKRDYPRKFQTLTSKSLDSSWVLFPICVYNMKLLLLSTNGIILAETNQRRIQRKKLEELFDRYIVDTPINKLYNDTYTSSNIGGNSNLNSEKFMILVNRIFEIGVKCTLSTDERHVHVNKYRWYWAIFTTLILFNSWKKNVLERLSKSLDNFPVFRKCVCLIWTYVLFFDGMNGYTSSQMNKIVHYLQIKSLDTYRSILLKTLP